MMTKDNDPVNYPSHYNNGKVEAIEAIEASMSAKEFRGYLKGAILKYIWRYTYKDRALEDLLKARWYLDKLISDGRLESDLKNEIKLND